MQRRDVLVRPVLPEETERFQELMQEHHYLGRLPKIGETLWYVALWLDKGMIEVTQGIAEIIGLGGRFES